jgi:hypothetical protein
MSAADEKIKNIALQLNKGVVPPKETPRSILLWFGASRRGQQVCSQIRKMLEKHGLLTSPDFESSYIDGDLTFNLKKNTPLSRTESGTLVADPTHKIGRLEAANHTPFTVKPDATIEEAVTLMLTRNFSQIPVMTTKTSVKGIISWKTIGCRLALGIKCLHVRDAMENAYEIGIDQAFFSAISIISKHDYVLVRAADQTICGIITASDPNVQFRKLAEPFLLLGEIENGIRLMFHGKFNKPELESARDPGDSQREIERVADLGFGEYIHLVESEKNWKKLKLEIDRVQFVKQLDRIRQIRNDVMHFDPDGLDDEDQETLREFAHFLKRLRDIGAV